MPLPSVSAKDCLCARRARDTAFFAVCGFGAFQALMPLIGYFAGSRFSGFVESIDHWIVFILLVLIGGNMIREAIAEGLR